MSPTRPQALFIADSPGIDFLNSFAHPGGQATEWLADGEDLIAWLVQATLLDEKTATTLRRAAAPGELDRIAAQARDLREWFRGFVRARGGRSLGRDAIRALAPLNRVLERDELYPVVAPGSPDGHGGIEKVVKRRWRTPDALLQPIACSIADVVSDPDFEHIKRCEGHACTLMFMDRTKGRARRWCSMAGCGNRAKQAAHRERLRQQGT